MQEYLNPTAYVDSDAATIIEQAKEIVGNQNNAYTASSDIRAWIFSNLKVQSDIGITRSGSDVLKSKIGVCRDYAILFASLARSAGIPSKVVSGLIYTDGAFYYHAWVECYTGQWTPFDATLSTDFVDATHIKLAEGDATTMFSLAKVIGTLDVEVLECSE
ncbi:MAG: transglutaminase domain-containing protein [Armatimonadetes bacterium]|nr:transglutaminase domain-containing protein [Armatimonadota bacterium]